MRSGMGAVIFITIILLLDIYLFQVIRSLSANLADKWKQIITIAFWSLSALSIIGFLFFAFTEPDLLGRKLRSYLFFTIMALFFAKLIACFFFLIDDIRRLIQWVINRFIYSSGKNTSMAEEGISRSAFLSWLGIGLGSTLFGSLIYGFSNKYNYHVKNVHLNYPNLPQSFKGLKIVQISDVHCGSFTDVNQVKKGIELIMEQKPDMILFTGDLVNDMASETKDYVQIFSLLKAPLGVFSVLGNHDYGDYRQWPFEGVSKEQNLANLKKIQADLGWRLLLNEKVIIEKNGERIALLGIENWSSKARFPKYGKMAEAYKGTEGIPFKILMSHDPSHWEAEVQPKYSDVDLMLSGHTHGMQFGVDIPGFKWSPVQYVYKQWAGLYETEKQKLYVNRGFGFIGYPGRVGILPEITVLNFS